MFYNKYSIIFRKLPLTIQDQSTNLLKFIENKQTLELPKFQTFPNCLSDQILLKIQEEYQLSRKLTNALLLQTIAKELSPLMPATFQNRSFIGLIDMVCSPISFTSFEKINSSFDEDGNTSLLSFFVFLEPFHSISWISSSHTFSIHPTSGLGVLFDHRIGYTVPEGEQHYPLVLQIKCLYNLLPENIFSLPIYDQTIAWRGQMKKCFINSGSFVDTKRSSSFQIDISRLEDPSRDQCNSCLQFIPITSLSCPVCCDKLIPQKQVISSRQNGIWISKSLYSF
jgi:hypothetical protein